MKRNVIIVVVLVVVAIICISISLLLNGKGTVTSSEQTASTKSSSADMLPVAACDVLTEKIAKSAIGNNLTDTPPASAASTNDNLSVTNCNYSTKADVSAGGVKMSGVSLLVRSALTNTGLDSNQQGFSSTKPSDAQTVSGIGDDAYYSAQYRQLNVLKGNNWYILSLYKDTLTNSTLAATKSLASKLEFK